MDYSSISSELIESLDYLRPPVKRITRNSGSDRNLGGIRLSKHFRSKLTKKTQFPQTKRRGVETSSSLILKKTAVKEVSENYTVLSYTNLFGEKETERSILTKQILGVVQKPIIKVTVTPKTVETQTSNIFKKRKHLAKKVQATVSNHEINSIKANNFFLVFGGQQKEEIYKFKRTGSAKSINSNTQKLHKDDNISLDQISSLKLVLDSLNMDRLNDVGNRGASRRLYNSPECPIVSRHFHGSEIVRECSCSNTAKGDNVPDVNTRRSCVRVTGRLGLTEDDRYVLKCNTTIDDEPVDSVRFYSAQRNDRRCQRDSNDQADDLTNECRRNVETKSTHLRCQRDSNDQADDRDLTNESRRNVETKSTHPRFKICACCNRLNCSFKSANMCSSFSKKDCNIQVDLPDRRSHETTSVSCGTTSRDQKCQSSHGTQVNFNVGFTEPECYTCACSVKDKVIQCSATNKDKESCDESTSTSGCDDKCLKRCQSPMVVISVYPIQSDSDNVKVVTDPPIDKRYLSSKKNLQINKTFNKETKTKKTVRDSRAANKSPNVNSPNRFRSPSRSPQTKIQSKTNVIENKVLRTNISRKSSPVRDRNTSPSKINRQVKINKEKSIFNTEINKNVGRPDRWSKRVNKSTNTEHNVTKKLLVDNYTKHLTFLMQKNQLERGCDCLQQNDSNGNINIKDSKTVKKKIDSKKAGSYNDKTLNISPSLKNFFIVPEKETKQRQRSVSQTVAHEDEEQQNEDTFTRLQVRDSLEICHRREGSPNSPTDRVNNEKNPNNKEKPPQTKHYRGDNCPIPDPLKRDQEIRALLGVDKGTHIETSKAHSVNHMRQRCAYDEKCYKDYKNFEELLEHPAKQCVCTDIMEKNSGPSSATSSKGRISNTSKHNTRNSNDRNGYDRNNDVRISNDRNGNSRNVDTRKGSSRNNNVKNDDDRNDDGRISNDRNGNSKNVGTRKGSGRNSNNRNGYDSNDDGRIRNDRIDNPRNVDIKKGSGRSSKNFKELRESQLKQCVCTDMMEKNSGYSSASNSNERISNTSKHNTRNSNDRNWYDRNNDGKISNGRNGNSRNVDTRKGSGRNSNNRNDDDRNDDGRISNDRNGNSKNVDTRKGSGRNSNNRNGYDSNDDGRISNDILYDNPRNVDTRKGSGSISNSRFDDARNGNDNKIGNASDSNGNTKNNSKSPSFPRTKCECYPDRGPVDYCECYNDDGGAADQKQNGDAEDQVQDGDAADQEKDEGAADADNTQNRPSTDNTKWCTCTNLLSPEKLGLDKVLKYFSSKKSITSKVTKSTQYEEAPVNKDSPVTRNPRTSLYQQLILNRNIQIFLQVEQFSKQKPIVLSRKQYDKVKRTIENTISNKSRRRTCICKTSLVSVGEVRRKPGGRQKSTKTEVEIQQESASDESKTASSSSQEPEQKAFFVFTGEQNSSAKDGETRQVESTVEFRCASMSYTKYITFSSTNVEVGSIPSPLDEKESLSLHTIFKGCRRCTTPNLGTSVYSLNSEDEKYIRPIKPPPILCEPKSKKPFLKRLMSCLVMRSRVTEMSPDPNASPPMSNKPSIGSSFDAYHISSSFCGVEMSSSMYDTSISFYTNHSVYPVNSKIKRGFFNSVREFLSIRKSQSMKNP